MLVKKKNLERCTYSWISQTSCLYFPENIVQEYFIHLLGTSRIRPGISVYADAKMSKDPFLIH